MRSIHKLAHIWTALCWRICPGGWCQQVIMQQNDGHNSAQNLDEMLITQLSWKVDSIHIKCINMNRYWWPIMLLCIRISENTAYKFNALTPWCRMTHICVCKLTAIGSDNGLSPGQFQAIIWTNARILFIWPFGTNFNEILIEVHIFSSKKCIWKCRMNNGGHFASASMC